MKNKKSNIIAYIIITVVLIITAGVFEWLFAKKTEAPVNIPTETTITPQDTYILTQTDSYIGWNTVTNTIHGISFRFPEKWIGSYSGPTTPDDFDINDYDSFILSPINATPKMCASIVVEINPWPFRKRATKEGDYCDPAQSDILIKCVDKVVDFGGDTYFGKIISDYSIKEVPFENRIIESARKGDGAYYYKNAFVNVNNTVISFTLVGDTGAKDDSECQEAIQSIDKIIKSIMILK